MANMIYINFISYIDSEDHSSGPDYGGMTLSHLCNKPISLLYHMEDGLMKKSAVLLVAAGFAIREIARTVCFIALNILVHAYLFYIELKDLNLRKAISYAFQASIVAPIQGLAAVISATANIIQIPLLMFDYLKDPQRTLIELETQNWHPELDISQARNKLQTRQI